MATVRTNIVREYRDLDLNFTIHPVKKDLNKLTAERAVVNSIKNLVSTNHYEKPFNPSFGSNLRRLLFESVDRFTAALIEREIIEVITNYEPRATVDNVIVSPTVDENGFNVQLEFFVVNQTNPLTINFFLERIR
jgi:phage baseplate assembly protein W